jgi:hypothetical protein
MHQAIFVSPMALSIHPVFSLLLNKLSEEVAKFLIPVQPVSMSGNRAVMYFDLNILETAVRRER